MAALNLFLNSQYLIKYPPNDLSPIFVICYITNILFISFKKNLYLTTTQNFYKWKISYKAILKHLKRGCSNEPFNFLVKLKELYDYHEKLYSSKFKLCFIFHNCVNIHDSTQVAEVFNHCFNSAFTTSQFTLPQGSELPTPLIQLSSIEINRSHVFKALVNPDTTKTCSRLWLYPPINPKNLYHIITRTDLSSFLLMPAYELNPTRTESS